MSTDAVPHRQLGVELFNRTWDLLDAERSPDDDLDLLLTATTSRWHWEQVGGDEQRATGDWQVARVLSALGIGELALRFADRSLTTTTAIGATGWRLASAHEGVARAHHARGDVAARDEHVAAALVALAEEPDAEDRAAIADQLQDLTEDPA